LGDAIVKEGSGFSLRIAREQESLTHKVVAALRRAIVDGEFEPGQRLVERTLCDLTGVSRTAIREALRTLEAEGLVVNIANHGPTVATISREQAEQIYTVREVLEVKAVELFLRRMGAVDLAALKKTVIAMEAAHAAGNTARVNAAKRDFYDVLIGRCGNEIIQQVLAQLFAKMAILRQMTMGQSNRTAEAIGELREVFDALAQRDEEAAREACLRHVKAAASVALGALRDS
jgi:GntR family transcriptional regulator, trigonelline degradation regulator